MEGTIFMIHILHHQRDEIVGILTNKADKKYWSDIHEIDLDGLNTHQFITFSKTSVAPFLEKRARYVIPAEEGGFYHEFIVMEAITRQHEKLVFAKGSYQDINKQNIVPPRKYEAWTLAEYVEFALENTEWQVGKVEFVGIRSTSIEEYLGAYDFLNTIRSLFDYQFEIRFRVQTEGNKIVGRYVDLLQQIGSNTKKEIAYKKDLLDLEKRVYNERIVTQLIALGPKREDGSRLQITVSDQDAFQRWNRNGYHLTDIYEPSIEDPENFTLEVLEEMAEAELKQRVNSVTEYTIMAATIEKLFPHETVRLGDRIRVVDTEFEPPLYAEARVINVRRSLSNPFEKQFIIGQVVEYDLVERQRDIIQLQGQYGLKIEKSITAPAGNFQVIWIDTSQIPNIPHTWNGSEWVKFAPTNAIEVGAETPEGATQKAAAAAGSALDSATQITEQRVKEAAETTLTNANEFAQQEAARAAGSALDTATTIAINQAGQAETNAKRYTDQRESEIRSSFLEFTQEFEGTTIVQSATAPTNPELNDLWVDISQTPYVWRRFNGSRWVLAVETSIQANSIETIHISTAGLDAGVIKFGTMSGDRIAANTIDANRLKAGSVIAEDITFSGKLQGATGTFSGSFIVGNPSDTNAPLLSLENNGVLTSRTYSNVNQGNEFIDRQVLVSAGSLRFLYEANVRGMYIDDEATIKMDSNGLLFSGSNIQFMSSVHFRSDTYHWGSLTEFNGSVNFKDDVSFLSGRTHFRNPVHFYENFATEGNSNAYFNGQTVELNPSVRLFVPDHPSGDFLVSRKMYIDQEISIRNEEVGFCGIGGIGGTGANIAGAGVNFRYRKAYLPSTIILEATSLSPNVEALAIDISSNGFWLYIRKSSGSSGAYYYWRGTYRA